MGTRILLAMVLTLGLRGGVAARAEGPSGETRVDLARGERPTGSWKPARDFSRGDAPTRRDEKQEERLDTLDEARINAELLEIEVDADRQQLVRMTGSLKQLEATTFDESAANLEGYRQKLAVLRQDFIVKSKALGRERRRVADLERELNLDVAAQSPEPAGLRWDDAGRIADLLLRGVDAWHRASSPSAPADPGRGDADRLLDLVRQGVDTLRGGPSETPPPPTSPSPSPDSPKLKDADRLLDLLRQGVETFKDATTPPASPSPSPSPSPPPRSTDPTLKDAGRVLELILKGVENWQRR